MAKASKKRKRVTILGVVLVLLMTYGGSYWGMSRRGFAWADAHDAEGFYFLVPHDSPVWWVGNYGLAFVYYPLVVVDNKLGTGRPLASEPMWDLDDGS